MEDILIKEHTVSDAVLYGIGVGVGDPGMITIRALQLIKDADVIVLPRFNKKECRAYNIALSADPSIEGKDTLSFDFDMISDAAARAENHRKIYAAIKEEIEKGKKVAFLTIGDPALYSTFSYIAELAEKDGIATETASGVSSMSACARALGISLCEGKEKLHIIPDVNDLSDDLKLPGTKVIMKSGRDIGKIKAILREHERRCKAAGKTMLVCAVSDCGMDSEKSYRGIDELPDDGTYMMTIIVKESS